MGRLDKYDSFIETSNYNVQEKKPLVKNQKKIEESKEKLNENNTSVALNLSRQRQLVCFVFLKKKTNNSKVYRTIVVPKKRIRKTTKMYLQVIDIKSMTRKLFRKDCIVKAKLTNKKIQFNQDMIKYK